MALNVVMVVDDDADVREALNDVLTEEGFSVLMAGDGFEALDLLRQRKDTLPRVILLDWMMPRCGGAEFRSLQASDPALAQIPVVLLTADGRMGPKMTAVQASGYLAKPVGVAELLEEVRRYC